MLQVDNLNAVSRNIIASKVNYFLKHIRLSKHLQIQVTLSNSKLICLSAVPSPVVLGKVIL